MFVDRAGLRYGSRDSSAAGEHDQIAGQHLAGASPVAGMFGDLPETEGLHEVVGAAHDHHTTALDNHQQILNDVAHHR